MRSGHRSLRLAALVGLLFAASVCVTSATEEVEELARADGQTSARVLLHISHVRGGCRGGCDVPFCSDTPIPMGTHYEAVLEVDAGSHGPIRARIPASDTWRQDDDIVLDVEGTDRVAVASLIDDDWQIAHLTTNGVFWDRVPRGASASDNRRGPDWDSVPTLADGIARIYARAPENERRLLLAELERRGGSQGLCEALAATVSAPPPPDANARAEAPPEIDVDPTEPDAWSRAADELDEAGKACLGGRLAAQIGHDFAELSVDAATLARHRVTRWADLESEALVPDTLARLDALASETPARDEDWRLLAARVAAAGLHEAADTRARCCAALPRVTEVDELTGGRAVLATTCLELLADSEDTCPAATAVLELDPCHPAIGCGKKGLRLCKASELPPLDLQTARGIIDQQSADGDRARLVRAALRVALRDEEGLPEALLARRKRQGYRLKQKRFGDSCVFAKEVGVTCTCADDDMGRAACSVPLEQTMASTEHCSFQIDDRKKRLHDVRSTTVFMSDAN